MKALHHDIWLIDSGYIRDQNAAIYLLRQRDEVAIIETGTTHSLPRVEAAMDALEINPGQVKYVIPTHIHLDHAGGAGAMMQAFDQARLIIHPRGARHMSDPSRLIEGVKQVYGEEKYKEYYGEITPIDAKRIDIAEDLSSFDLAGRDLLFLDTPGHARHHFCVFDETSNGFFTGDTFGIAYPQIDESNAYRVIPTTTPVQFDPVALKASIERLLSYRPDSMYLTHYGELENPLNYRDTLDWWIDRYVESTESVQPADADADKEISKKLSKFYQEKFDMDEATANDLLDVDIRLNGSGLGIWWRQQQEKTA